MSGYRQDTLLFSSSISRQYVGLLVMSTVTIISDSSTGMEIMDANFARASTN